MTDYTLPVIGMGCMATYAAQAGHNVGLLDAEAHALYQEAAGVLRGMGVPVLVIDTVRASPEAVAARIMACAGRPGPLGSPESPTQGAIPQ